MRLISSDGSWRCPGGEGINGVEFLSYWCVALGSFRGGFELIFEGVITDIAGQPCSQASMLRSSLG
ncbi:hypothetical protein [Vulcanisaeta distributa]|uniref:hypothetical protein n=1 Tax=Vulcanisaeta distributa TaxID=164451 RepID=UPI0006D2A4AE|nr:hypothetical protein [Vulcanisaeta distributa]